MKVMTKIILFGSVLLFGLALGENDVLVTRVECNKIFKVNEKSTYKYYVIEADVKSLKKNIKRDSVKLNRYAEMKAPFIKLDNLTKEDSSKLAFVNNSLENFKQKHNKKLDSLAILYARLHKADSNKLEARSNIYEQTASYTGALKFDYKGHVFYAFIADLDSHKIKTHWKAKSGEKYFNLKSLKKELSSKKENVLCLTNGGMYTPSNNPEGLLISNNIEVAPIDTGFIDNLNFYMMPNGVFYEKNGKVEIKTTEDYLSIELDSVEYATQSGPMLLINGKHHPAFNYGSKSRKLRSGVGVRENGNVVFIISENSNVNFHEFATVFRELFNCKNALFLDGAISKMYLKGIRPNELGGNFGPII